MQQQYSPSVTVAELRRSLMGLRADSVIVFRCRSSEDKQLVFSRYESRGENLWTIELTEIEREQRVRALEPHSKSHKSLSLSPPFLMTSNFNS